MQFYCCGSFQNYGEYIDRINKQKYHYGECSVRCKKKHLVRNGEEITGKRAKEIWASIKHKLRQDTSRYDKYRAKTVRRDSFRYLIPAKKKIKGVLTEYQIEKMFISGYSTGFTTLSELTA